MSHHSSEGSVGGIPDWLEKQLGATKKFPDGKVNESDEGEIKFALAFDSAKKLIHVNFGKPVAWFSMRKREALGLAAELKKLADEI